MFYVLVLAAPVIGAVVYAIGVKRLSLPLRIAGGVIALGSWLVAALLVALSSD
jgi:hypothetical protein